MGFGNCQGVQAREEFRCCAHNLFTTEVLYTVQPQTLNFKPTEHNNIVKSIA